MAKAVLPFPKSSMTPKGLAFSHAYYGQVSKFNSLEIVS